MDVRARPQKRPKNWCFWTVVLEKTFESPLDCKEIKPVSPKGKSTLNIHWKDWCWSWSSNTLAIWCEELTHWKRPCCWKILRAKRRRKQQDETVGWHHWLNGHESEQTLGDGEDREAWHAVVSRVTKSQTWLSDWTTTTRKCELSNKETATVIDSPGTKWSMELSFPE